MLAPPSRLSKELGADPTALVHGFVPPVKPEVHQPAASPSVQVAASLSAGLVSALGSRHPRHRCRPRWPCWANGSDQKAVYDFIEEAGVGSYQIEQVLLVACFFFSEAAELDVISPLTTAWRLEWALVTDQVALLASIGYLGFAAGTLLAGVLGDNFGRRVPILLGYLGVMAGSFGMWSAPSPLVVGVFRALTGFSVGIGVPASLTTIAEIAPAKSRAMLISVCYAALALGGFYADLGLYFFLPDLKSGDWRSLCLWSAIPAAIAFPIALFELEDTPIFHQLKGDTENVKRVLSKMAERNDRSVRWSPAPSPPADLKSSNEADVLELFKTSAVPLLGCAMLDFAYNFTGFGCGYFFPLFISELAEGAPIPPVGELVLANLVAFPAFYLSTQVLNLDVGYKKILVGIALVEICACLCLMQAGVPILEILGIFALKLMMVSFSQTVNVVKSETFPSKIRVSALSVSGTCGRMGALLAPALIEETRGAPNSPEEFRVFLSILVAVLIIAASVGVSLLPESKGKSLA